MKLIVGLGNPDKEYQNTRHNFGWLVLDALTEKKQLKWTKHQAGHSFITDFNHGREKIILVKPLTYMNNSGQAVGSLQQFFKIPTTDIIIVHDDIDLPFGKIRISTNRSAGGHKGLESIISHLKTKDFKRIRLGIGPQTGAAEDFVLKKFNSSEKRKLSEIIDTSHLILETILEKGFTWAANKYN